MTEGEMSLFSTEEELNNMMSDEKETNDVYDANIENKTKKIDPQDLMTMPDIVKSIIDEYEEQKGTVKITKKDVVTLSLDEFNEMKKAQQRYQLLGFQTEDDWQNRTYKNAKWDDMSKLVNDAKEMVRYFEERLAAMQTKSEEFTKSILKDSRDMDKDGDVDSKDLEEKEIEVALENARVTGDPIVTEMLSEKAQATSAITASDILAEALEQKMKTDSSRMLETKQTELQHEKGAAIPSRETVPSLEDNSTKEVRQLQSPSYKTLAGKNTQLYIETAFPGRLNENGDVSSVLVKIRKQRQAEQDNPNFKGANLTNHVDENTGKKRDSAFVSVAAFSKMMVAAGYKDFETPEGAQSRLRAAVQERARSGKTKPIVTMADNVGFQANVMPETKLKQVQKSFAVNPNSISPSKQHFDGRLERSLNQQALNEQKQENNVTNQSQQKATKSSESQIDL